MRVILAGRQPVQARGGPSEPMRLLPFAAANRWCLNFKPASTCRSSEAC
jgi:hypothetical protein